MAEARVIRVFPRRTNATPIDADVRVGCGPGLFDRLIDEVWISVAFTWDLPRAEFLAKEWRGVSRVVKIGGPATGEPSGDFVPGRFLKRGYTITSRGCPNRCWFCSVWKREGQTVRELPIEKGWNLLDDNLLACSDKHVERVFAMLRGQPATVRLTGGLDAKRLRAWHVEELVAVKPEQVFFAYDTPDDLEPLIEAGRMLHGTPLSTRRPGKPLSARLRCFVLCGWKHDSLRAAENRMLETLAAGFVPMAMLYRDEQNVPPDNDWRRFQRRWARPALIWRFQKEQAKAAMEQG